MNVANLELSSELYMVSGWETGTTGFTHVNDSITFGWVPHGTPAYDLGYLLRKLPEEVELNNNTGNEGAWRAIYYDYVLKTQGRVEAPNPEDAVAKLAIELFKAGVLTKASA